MTIDELKQNAPSSTEYICAIYNCDIEYFKTSNGDDLLEFDGKKWVLSRTNKCDLNVNYFDVLICCH